MVLSQRQRRRLGRELRDVVFRLCSGGGLLLGLLWGVRHDSGKLAHVSACDTSRLAHHDSHVAGMFGHCISNGLVSGMLPILVPSGMGLAVGVLVGVLVASLIRLGRKPQVAKSKAPAVEGSSAGQWIRARYPGNCKRCSYPVQAGDRIRWSTTMCCSPAAAKLDRSKHNREERTRKKHPRIGGRPLALRQAPQSESRSKTHFAFVYVTTRSSGVSCGSAQLCSQVIDRGACAACSTTRVHRVRRAGLPAVCSTEGASRSCQGVGPTP